MLGVWKAGLLLCQQAKLESVKELVEEEKERIKKLKIRAEFLMTELRRKQRFHVASGGKWEGEWLPHLKVGDVRSYLARSSPMQMDMFRSIRGQVTIIIIVGNMIGRSCISIRLCVHTDGDVTAYCAAGTCGCNPPALHSEMDVL